MLAIKHIKAKTYSRLSPVVHGAPGGYDVTVPDDGGVVRDRVERLRSLWVFLAQQLPRAVNNPPSRHSCAELVGVNPEGEGMEVFAGGDTAGSFHLGLSPGRHPPTGHGVPHSSQSERHCKKICCHINPNL